MKKLLSLLCMAGFSHCAAAQAPQAGHDAALPATVAAAPGAVTRPTLPGPGDAAARPELPTQPRATTTPAASPAPTPPAAQTPAASPEEQAACPHCDRAEQLVVDLIYYQQVLDLLVEIARQREQVDAGLLRAAHAELARIRPELKPLLKPERAPAPKKPRPGAAGARKPAPPAAKTGPTSGADSGLKPGAKPASKPKTKAAARPSGIAGLTVGHVNEANPELGIKASVVLVSNGRPRSLGLNGVIEHNRRKFRIIKVEYVQDRRAGNRHEVHLQDQRSKKVYVAPWQ